MPLLVFFQRIATVTHNAFQWARQPQKLPLSLGGFGSHLIQSYLGPPESVSQTASRLVQLFAGLTNVSNRHTERPTSVALVAAAMQPENKNQYNSEEPVKLIVRGVSTEGGREFTVGRKM